MDEEPAARLAERVGAGALFILVASAALLAIARARLGRA
jgi:hypothetical protein